MIFLLPNDIWESHMLEKELYELSAALGRKLQENNLSITCAESCTGGWLAKVITDVEGSSVYFDRGFITYSNQAKQDLLGVTESTLSQHGAVSEVVVQEMAFGALLAARADIAIAISGIAGPKGGTTEKPVGTVCFGFVYRESISRCYTCYFTGDREAIRRQAVIFSIKTAFDEIL